MAAPSLSRAFGTLDTWIQEVVVDNRIAGIIGSLEGRWLAGEAGNLLRGGVALSPFAKTRRPWRCDYCGREHEAGTRSVRVNWPDVSHEVIWCSDGCGNYELTERVVAYHTSRFCHGLCLYEWLELEARQAHRRDVELWDGIFAEREANRDLWGDSGGECDHVER